MAADGLSGLSALETAGRIDSGEVSRDECLDFWLARVADEDLGGYLWKADRETAVAGVDTTAQSPAAGVPVAVKDIFCTTGVPTTAASKILEGYIPPYTANSVSRLFDAGLPMLGKTNMDEFAMGSSNENSAFGPVLNPWDTTRVPGGSSGGSAAIVAANVVAFATGSDTGGSVRQPAAFCGVTGFKPSYGRVSRYGMVAYASSLDQAGVIARSAADCADVLQAMAGHDPRDATSVDRTVDDYRAALDRGVRGLRIGIARELFSAGVSDAMQTTVHRALHELEAAGAIPVSYTHLTLPTIYSV